MNEQQKIIDLLKQSLEEKIKALDETRERLIEANNLIYEISKQISVAPMRIIEKDKFKLMIDEYVYKITK